MQLNSSALKTMFTNFERHAGLYSEPQLIRPQGGCYPARINAECLAFDGYEQIEGNFHDCANVTETQYFCIREIGLYKYSKNLEKF